MKIYLIFIIGLLVCNVSYSQEKVALKFENKIYHFEKTKKQTKFKFKLYIDNKTGSDIVIAPIFKLFPSPILYCDKYVFKNDFYTATLHKKDTCESNEPDSRIIFSTPIRERRVSCKTKKISAFACFKIKLNLKKTSQIETGEYYFHLEYHNKLDTRIFAKI